MLINIKDLVEDRLCYEKVRELRWSEGVKCRTVKVKVINAMVTTIIVNIGIVINVKVAINIMTTWR